MMSMPTLIVTIDRERVIAIVHTLQELIKHEGYSKFTIELSSASLIITPKSMPIDITL